MAEKQTHFGRAGEYAALSEFLLRGYNVAVPSVDVGDDVFIIDDREGTTWRVQIKSGDRSAVKAEDAATMTVQYTLSRRQLREQKATELYFMLMVRWFLRWRFLLIPRSELADLRNNYVKQPHAGPGRRPVGDHESKSDSLNLSVTWTHCDAEGWGSSLHQYMDKWPPAFAVLAGGPGARIIPPTSGR
jgi:hypothetical protein